jgi:hypothetical protein
MLPGIVDPDEQKEQRGAGNDEQGCQDVSA